MDRCCCRTLPSIVNEDVEAIFYALDDNANFKVCFVHRCFFIVFYCFIFLANSEILHQFFWVLSMLGI